MKTLKLTNIIQVIKKPNTQSTFFKNVKKGDVIEISIDVNTKLQAIDLKNLRTGETHTSLRWDFLRTLNKIDFIDIK